MAEMLLHVSGPPPAAQNRNSQGYSRRVDRAQNPPTDVPALRQQSRLSERHAARHGTDRPERRGRRHGWRERREERADASQRHPEIQEEPEATARKSRAGRGGSATACTVTCTTTTTTATTLAARQLGFAPRGRAKATRCAMNAHAARRKVFDLTRGMLFRRGDATDVVQFDAPERMVRNGPITG